MHLLKVSWISSQMRKEDGSLSHPIYPSLRSVALSSSSPLGNNVPKLTTQSPQAGSKISPAVLFIIVILAVIFFISGLLHLLVRLLIKQPPSSSSESDRYPEPTSSDVIQRQLQQLFHLHDSGLDQAVIDSLPVFLYKEIIGLNRPFDCAVCLCEFLIEDKLRLLPVCSHAFHVNCIDTWLLSNSSCPLCRGTLFASATITIENPVFNFDDSREEGRFAGVDCEDGISNTYQKSKELDEMTAQKRIFPVRLGKFQSSNDLGETSSSNLDSRRCYSMGSFQYIVGDSNLQVSLGERRINSRIIPKRIEMHGNIGVLDDKEAKKLGYGGKGESFSVSKIWLWPKKGVIPNSSIGINDIYSTNSGFPWISRSEDV